MRNLTTEIATGAKILNASIQNLLTTCDTDALGYRTTDGTNRSMMVALTAQAFGFDAGLPIFYISTNGDPCVPGMEEFQINASAAKFLSMLGDQDGCSWFPGMPHSEWEAEEEAANFVRRVGEGVDRWLEAIDEYEARLHWSSFADVQISESLDWSRQIGNNARLWIYDQRLP